MFLFSAVLDNFLWPHISDVLVYLGHGRTLAMPKARSLTYCLDTERWLCVSWSSAPPSKTPHFTLWEWGCHQRECVARWRSLLSTPCEWREAFLDKEELEECLVLPFCGSEILGWRKIRVNWRLFSQSLFPRIRRSLRVYLQSLFWSIVCKPLKKTQSLIIYRVSQKNALSESSLQSHNPSKPTSLACRLQTAPLTCQLAGRWFWKCVFLGHPVDDHWYKKIYR